MEAPSPKSIGAALKEARERKSVSLEDVHTKIKIHPRVLQLLEDNKFDKLPSPLFVKSFLKSYAEFLEINAGELLEIYEKEGRREPEQVLFIKPAEIREKVRHRQASDKKWMPALAIPALAAAAIAGLFFSYQSLKSHTPVKSAAPAIKKSAKPAAPSSAQTASKAKAEGWIRSVSQGNFPALDKSDALKLKIKALDNVWLRVTCDGKVLFQSILKKGAEESWSASKSVEIWTGNSSNMALSLNGYSLGSPGKGVVKRLTITHQGVKIAS